jgi:hypothetical protein
MRLTPEDGLRSAKKLASEKWDDYAKANLTYGNTLIPFLGHLPKTIAMGHLLRVNPKLQPVLPVTKDRRRGFMLATIEAAHEANVAWENLDNVTTGAYIWGRDINYTSLKLYTTDTSVFASPGEDFWRCAYLAHVLGETPFKRVWAGRDTSQPTVYGGLVASVDNLRQRIPGWTIIQLKKTVFVECAFVFEIAKRGGSLISEGYGIQPVLTKSQYLDIFTRG